MIRTRVCNLAGPFKFNSIILRKGLDWLTAAVWGVLDKLQLARDPSRRTNIPLPRISVFGKRVVDHAIFSMWVLNVADNTAWGCEARVWKREWAVRLEVIELTSERPLTQVLVQGRAGKGPVFDHWKKSVVPGRHDPRSKRCLSQNQYVKKVRPRVLSAGAKMLLCHKSWGIKVQSLIVSCGGTREQGVTCRPGGLRPERSFSASR